MKVYKRGNRWWADLRAEGLGRMPTGATQEREARRIAKRLAEGGAAGKRLSDALTRAWDEHYAGSKGQRNARSIHNQLMAALGDLPLDMVTTLAVRKYSDDCRTRQGKAGPTINRHIAHLGRTLRLACEWGWLDNVPVLIRQPGDGNQRHRELTGSEEAQLFLQCEDWFVGLGRFLLDTGARLSEALKVTEVDRARAIATGVWLVRDTKSGKDRSVPLTGLAKGALFNWSWQGKTPRQCQREWDRVRKLMGLAEDKGFVIHCLRHTCASRLLQGGLDIKKVSTWLGHANVSVTERYAHLNVEALREGVAVLESVPSRTTKG